MTHFDRTQSKITRRDVLRAGASGAAAVALGSRETFAWGAEDNAYKPFFMGIQSYSLRGYKFEEALERTQKLGLRFWEAFPAHVPLTAAPEQIAEMLAKLKAAKIKLYAWGVVGFDSNPTNARKTFEFAKAMGIRVISADPSPEALPILDRLLKEYSKHDIYIAIHNHGPGARYDKFASIAQAVQGRHPRLGVCVDTGHVLRSGEDPVEWIKRLDKRVFGIHLKDVKSQTQFTELGQGDLRMVDLFRLLRERRYRSLISLEYEEHANEPGPYISICLAAARDAIEKSANL